MTCQPRPAVEDLVSTYWPHPVYDRDSVASAVAAAGELVRYANHATLNASAETLPHAHDVEGVTSALYELTARLPQLVQQLQFRLEHLATEDPTLYAYTGNASTVTAAAIRDYIRVESLAVQLSRELDSARQHLANVGHRTRPGDEEGMEGEDLG